MDDIVVLAIIAALPGLAATWLSHRTRKDIREVHVIVNSQKTELLNTISSLEAALKVSVNKEIEMRKDISTAMEGK